MGHFSRQPPLGNSQQRSSSTDNKATIFHTPSMATLGLLCLLACTSLLAQLAAGAPLSTHPPASPVSLRDDDVPLPPEVVVEALFGQVDSLQDELEECEEQVRTKLQTSSLHADIGVSRGKPDTGNSQNPLERQERTSDTGDDPTGTVNPEGSHKRGYGDDDDFHEIGDYHVKDNDNGKKMEYNDDSDDEERSKDHVRKHEKEDHTRRPQDEGEDDNDEDEHRERIVSIDLEHLKDNDDERERHAHDKTENEKRRHDEDDEDDDDDDNSLVRDKDNKKDKIKDKDDDDDDDDERPVRGKGDREKKPKDEDERHASRLEDLLRDFADKHEKSQRKRRLNDDDNEVDETDDDDDDDDATDADDGDNDDDDDDDEREINNDNQEVDGVIVNNADDIISDAVVDKDGVQKNADGDDEDDDDDDDEVDNNKKKDADTDDDDDDNDVDDDDDQNKLVGLIDKTSIFDDFSEKNNKAVNHDKNDKGDDHENIRDADKINVEDEAGDDVGDIIKDTLKIDEIFQDGGNKDDDKEEKEVARRDEDDDANPGIAKGREESFKLPAEPAVQQALPVQQNNGKGETSPPGKAAVRPADTIVKRIRRESGHLQTNQEGAKYLPLIRQLTERIGYLKQSIAACSALRNNVGESKD